MIVNLYALWAENWKLNYAVYAVLFHMSPFCFHFVAVDKVEDGHHRLNYGRS